MVKHIKIINIDVVIKKDEIKARNAFVSFIADKQQSNDVSRITQAVDAVLQQNDYAISDMNCGRINAHQFTEHMIVQLSKMTNVTFNHLEFDAAWNTMYPTFSDFKDSLQSAIDYNTQPDQRIIFMALTNSKDMTHLVGELSKHKLIHKESNGYLDEIMGISIYLTYSRRKTGAELLGVIMDDLKAEMTLGSSLVRSMGAIFNADQSNSNTPIVIEYIHRLANSCQSTVTALEKSRNRSLVELQVMAQAHSIPVLEWTYSDERCLPIVR